MRSALVALGLLVALPAQGETLKWWCSDYEHHLQHFEIAAKGDVKTAQRMIYALFRDDRCNYNQMMTAVEVAVVGEAPAPGGPIEAVMWELLPSHQTVYSVRRKK